jgi:nicotinamide-nucleotide amidase
LKIEVLTTGDELLEGICPDLNSAHLAREIFQAGLRVSRFHTVGDTLSTLCDLINEIARRADVCLITGGLGPTTDDLTLDALSQVAEVQLIEDPEVWAEIQRHFPNVLKASTSNRRQARVPEGGEALLSEVGTAPGMKIQIHGCTFFAYPGVPRELQWHCAHSFMPWLRERLGDLQSFQRTLRFCLISESLLNERIQALDLPEGLIVGYQSLGVEHRLKLKSPHLHDIEHVTSLIRSTFPVAYLNDEDRPLSAMLLKICQRHGLTLGFAESCTGGAVSSSLVAHPGASSVLMGGIVSYANEVKRTQLGVRDQTLLEQGAVSEACAREMALGARRALNVDWAVSITGVAGPDGGSEAKPVGTVYFGWAGPDYLDAQHYRFNGSRGRVQHSATAYALLGLLRRVERSILNTPSSALPMEEIS